MGLTAITREYKRNIDGNGHRFEQVFGKTENHRAKVNKATKITLIMTTRVK